MLNEGAQFREYLPAVRVVPEHARTLRTIFRENRSLRVRGEGPCHHRLRHLRETDAVDRGTDQGGKVARDQGTRDNDLKRFAPLDEPPGRRAPEWPNGFYCWGLGAL